MGSILLYTAVAVLFCIYPAHSFTGAWAGFVLWATTVLPALYPFFIISSLLQSSGVFLIAGKFMEPFMRTVFRVPGACGAVAVLSMISGSPSGARMTASLYAEGLINSKEAQRLAAFTTTCGPSFLLGSVGVSMLMDARAGIFVLIAHYLGAFINGIIFRFALPGDVNPETTIAPGTPQQLTIGEAVSNSAMAIMTVGGFIGLFSAITTAIRALFSPLAFMQIPWINAVFCTFMEMVSGCSATASLSLPTDLKAALVCGAASFGGLSVLAQSMAFLKKTGISSAVFLLSKLTHALLSFSTCYLLMSKFPPPALPVSTSAEVMTTTHIPVILTIIGIISAILCCFWILWCDKFGYPQVYTPSYPYYGNTFYPIFISHHSGNDISQTMPRE